MSFNKFDIRVQEAAKHHQPEPDKEAWDKMEKLLDVHLPQKRDIKRRGMWLWILSFIIVGACLFIFIMSPFSGGNTKEKKQTNPQSSLKKNSLPSEGSASIVIADKERANVNSSLNKLPPKIKPRTNILFNKDIRQKNRSNKEVMKSASNKNPEKQLLVYDSKDVAGNNFISSSIKSDSKQKRENDKASNPILEPITDKNIPPKIIVNDDSSSKKKEEVILSPINRNISRKATKKFNTSFSLTLSAGPDVSAVEPLDPGKLKVVYGLGAAYNLSKRWTVRAGFYVAKKAYDAEVGDYHPPARFWNYYPDLDYIDADCAVYEVPVILNYNFAQKAKHFWFGSAGVSSYFMKKETYYYYPKDPMASYPNNSYSISNKNEHFLSSLRLSGGYASAINKNIFISAEPYINLPLSGVGFGKVKLYSAGILFTLSVKPFAKK